MDNFTIDVTTQGQAALVFALSLCLDQNAPGGKVSHWREQDGVLILLWHEDGPNCHPMLAGGGAAGVSAAVTAWLEAQDYGKQPDHDGDNGKGFRVFTEAWGHVKGCHRAVCGVEPAWALYGK